MKDEWREKLDRRKEHEGISHEIASCVPGNYKVGFLQRANMVQLGFHKVERHIMVTWINTVCIDKKWRENLGAAKG